MQLWQIGEKVVDNGIGFDFQEIRIFQSTFFQPSDDNHTASVLKDTKGLCILLMAFYFVSDALQILLDVLPCSTAVCRFNTDDIFKHKHAWLIALQESCIKFVQIIPRILSHRNFHVAALCSANKRVCLAWRTTNDDINL